MGESAARFAESSSQRPKCGRSLSSTRSANVSPSTTTLTPLNMRGSMGHIVLEPANKGFGTYGGGGGWGGGLTTKINPGKELYVSSEN